MPSSAWTEGLQRAVLALALRPGPDGLLAQLGPGVFTQELFLGPDGLADGALPPRARLAGLIAAYAERYQAAPPAVAVDELVAREAAGAGADAEYLRAEWAWVRAQAFDQDWAEWNTGRQWLLDEVRKAVGWRRLTQRVIEAAAVASKGPETLDDVRAVLARALEDADVGAGGRPAVGWLASGDARVDALARGDEGAARVPTGFARLDTLLEGGPARGEVFYVLAPPKGAKTSFLVTMAKAAASRGLGVFFASFEMRAARVLGRHDRAFTASTREELRADPERLRRALRAARGMGVGEILVWEASPQLRDAAGAIAQQVRRARAAGARVDLVCADYLNIMGASRQEREKRHELARISRDLSALAKDLDVVVWSAALVKREAVNRQRVQKTDIGEAFEVIAVLDGAVAVCGDADMRAARQRILYAVALREAEDERAVGVYEVDLGRLIFRAAGEAARDKDGAEGGV